MTDRARLIGVTGNMGSGKSTLAAMLGQRGAAVVDADSITHDVLLRDDVKSSLCDAFGDITDANGQISRLELARRAFADSEHADLLNRVIRPFLEPELWRRIRCSRAEAGARGIVVLDAPLIVEWGIQDLLEWLVVVVAREEVASRRLQASRGMTAEEVARRVSAQTPAQTKVRLADRVIQNEGSMEDLEKSAERLWCELAAMR